MKITQSKIDEIASSLDIVEIISQYTQLKKAGRSFMGRCPFHQEKTPSFSVSQEKGVYHCFGCGKSGNIFNFIMDIDNVSFYEAVKLLAEKANIKIEFDEEPYEDKNKIEILYEINKAAARFYYDILMSYDGIYAKEYLNHRGIRDETITKFGLGFSLRQKESLVKELSKSYKNQDLIDSGVALDNNQNEVRDRFRGRVMFPIISESNRVVGFGARKIFPDDSLEGKYVNSPETKIYNKSKILFGLNFAKDAIRKIEVPAHIPDRAEEQQRAHAKAEGIHGNRPELLHTLLAQHSIHGKRKGAQQDQHVAENGRPARGAPANCQARWPAG